MVEFAYKIRNHLGAIEDGTIMAGSHGEALSRISSGGANVIALKEQKKPLSINIPFLDRLLHRIKLKDKILFTRNLSGMLHAGLPMYRALSVLEKQAKNEQLKMVLKDLMKDIHDGSPLSEGMKKHSRVFPPFFSAMVRAGEESGGLPAALETVGAYLTKTYDLHRKIKSAMMYPSVIVGIIILVGILMFIFVVPTLVGMFSELGGELPKSTQFIVWLSDSLQASGLILLAGAGLIFGGGTYLFKQPKVKRAFHRFLIWFPLVRSLIVEMNAARTSRTLASLLGSGVSLIQALAITQEVVQNSAYQDALQDAATRVEKGVSLAEVFMGYPKIFPAMMSEMVQVGEETGNVSEMLLDIAEFYEEEVDAKTQNLSTIVEPLLMVFIGGAVGFFAISMIQPMYSVLDNF